MRSKLLRGEGCSIVRKGAQVWVYGGIPGVREGEEGGTVGGQDTHPDGGYPECRRAVAVVLC